MNVDVIYQGLALAKAAQARSEGAALFVELEAPMPVGTALDLVTPDGTRSGRVESVIEGVGAGMLIAFGARKTAEPNAPMQEMKSAPVVAATEAEKEDDEPDEKPDDKPDDAARKKKGRKQRKTIIGH